jgi:hypothetical protein
VALLFSFQADARAGGERGHSQTQEAQGHLIVADFTSLLQLGGMGVMAFAAIAVTRILVPILSALSDRLLDALERQTLAIDRLGDVAASMDKRLIIVEQQIDMLQDLVHGVIWPHQAERRSSRRKPNGGIAILDDDERASSGQSGPTRTRSSDGRGSM